MVSDTLLRSFEGGVEPNQRAIGEVMVSTCRNTHRQCTRSLGNRVNWCNFPHCLHTSPLPPPSAPGWRPRWAGRWPPPCQTAAVPHGGTIQRYGGYAAAANDVSTAVVDHARRRLHRWPGRSSPVAAAPSLVQRSGHRTASRSPWPRGSGSGSYTNTSSSSSWITNPSWRAPGIKRSDSRFIGLPPGMPIRSLGVPV
jgi:hypothetical protein